MTLDLDRSTFIDRCADRPVVARVTAPLPAPSPLAAYTALNDESTDRYAFLLESAEKVASSDPDGAFRPSAGDRHARFSFIGYDPAAVVSVGPDGTAIEVLRETTTSATLDPDDSDGDVLDVLRSVLPDIPRVGFPDGDRQRLEGGLVGFLAYDAVYDLWLDDVGVDRPDPIVPDAHFVVSTKTVAIDHATDTATLVFTPVLDEASDPDTVYDELDREAEDVASRLEAADEPSPTGFSRTADRTGGRAEYESTVRRAKEHVLDGDIYQGVFSRKRILEGDIDPLGFYAALREVNPSPYMYLLEFDDYSVVGASPETLVSVRGREVVGNPIAGTCPRGSSPVEDRRLAGEMLADAKERAEHTMLVDLARNDLGRVSDPGSVTVDEFMNVLKYSHVQHIESTVTGRLEADADAFDAIRATFPAGTLTGAPKIRAMELIDAYEAEPRGLYGGGVGYVSWTGDADFAIVIRTATIEHGDPDRVTVQAGAGIVADSDPASEFEETERKMDGVLDALDRLEPFEPEARPR